MSTTFDETEYMRMYLRKWRKEHPDYHKHWLAAHPGYQKELYRKNRYWLKLKSLTPEGIEKRRAYNREYMRKYREDPEYREKQKQRGKAWRQRKKQQKDDSRTTA